MICISNIINISDLASINALIDTKNDQDGFLTAGLYASQVKHNKQQLSGDALAYAQNILCQEFENNQSIQNYCFPKKYTPMRFARYYTGMFYGKHIDNIYHDHIRTDISFTVFLSDPKEYEGGALRIYDGMSYQDIKLDAGSIILYPSDSLHEVTSVTKGERLVLIGWIESYISDVNIRKILTDLAILQDILASNTPNSPEHQLAMHSFNRLYRLNS